MIKRVLTARGTARKIIPGVGVVTSGTHLIT